MCSRTIHRAPLSPLIDFHAYAAHVCCSHLQIISFRLDKLWSANRLALTLLTSSLDTLVYQTVYVELGGKQNQSYLIWKLVCARTAVIEPKCNICATVLVQTVGYTFESSIFGVFTEHNINSRKFLINDRMFILIVLFKNL